MRELESLARRDVGAWWVCGGHQPDHSTIGKFIQLHAEALSEEFFVALVKNLISKLRLAAGTVGGDGTVIEAAASHFRTLRAAAVQRAAAIAQERSDLRRRHAGAGDILISPSEPEAVVQPLKDGVARPSYKPTAMVHEAGLIVGQQVEPSNERAALQPMLEQHAAAFGASPSSVLLDCGICQLSAPGPNGGTQHRCALPDWASHPNR